MTYSLIGILSVLIQIIVNLDIFRKNHESRVPAVKYYRLFLLSAILFHVSDAVWGFMNHTHLPAVLYVNTVVSFAAIALSVLTWMLFVVHYLEDKQKFDRVLYYIGWVLFAFQIALLVINMFEPILFRLNQSGEYVAGGARYAVFGIYVMMFLMTSIHVFTVALRTKGRQKRRHLIVGLFGIVMILAVTVQIFEPMLPLYSIGYLLGCCVLHTFVVEDEKAEYLRELEASHYREELQKKELAAAKNKINTDELTGVKSKYAYAEAEANLDLRLAAGQVEGFAVAVFDLNNLKRVNDVLGHEAGNKYIAEACRYICDTFTHSPVFRIGGDEFVAILEGRDYDNREQLMGEFQRQMEENMVSGKTMVISHGMAEFEPGSDSGYSDVFSRADERMYRNKWLVKERAAKLFERPQW